MELKDILIRVVISLLFGGISGIGFLLIIHVMRWIERSYMRNNLFGKTNLKIYDENFID